MKWRIKIRNMLVVRVDSLPVAGQPSQLPMNFRRYFLIEKQHRGKSPRLLINIWVRVRQNGFGMA